MNISLTTVDNFLIHLRSVLSTILSVKEFFKIILIDEKAISYIYTYSAAVIFGRNQCVCWSVNLRSKCTHFWTSIAIAGKNNKSSDNDELMYLWVQLLSWVQSQQSWGYRWQFALMNIPIFLRLKFFGWQKRIINMELIIYTANWIM